MLLYPILFYNLLYLLQWLIHHISKNTGLPPTIDSVFDVQDPLFCEVIYHNCYNSFCVLFILPSIPLGKITVVWNFLRIVDHVKINFNQDHRNAQ